MNNLDAFLTGLDRHSLKNQLSRELKGCDTAVELGCGFNSPLLEYGFTSRLKISAIDIWEPYIAYHNQMMHYEDCQVADIVSLELPEKRFDAVILLDTLEHLKKPDAEIVLRKAAIWARKKVIVQVPNGSIANKVTDHNPYQNHLSSWFADDFWQKGFTVHGIDGLKQLRRENGSSVMEWQFMGHFSNLLTNPVVFGRPDYAFHLLAVKSVNKDNR